MLTRHPRPETEVVAEVPRQPEPPSSRAWLRERVDTWVVIAVGLSWFVLTPIAAALEPATDQPEPLIGTLLNAGMDVLFVAMLIGLALRRRWGLAASFAGSVVVTTMVVACPTSGHHQFGIWWFGEMVCALALIGISAAALRRSSIAPS
jgi:hypothetical protein